MEKERTFNNTPESGVALVMALIITLVMLLMIVSLSYFLTTGFRGNIINRQFTTVYESAQGGVEYSSGVINTYLKSATTPTNVGGISPDSTTLSNIVTTCTGSTATITIMTADGKYSVVTEVKCLGVKAIPGYGGALRFPPPPPERGGGTGSMSTKYIFYSEIAKSKETITAQNIGQSEVIYRAIQ